VPAQLWRERHPEVRGLPGVDLGRREIASPLTDVSRLFDDGVRCVTIEEPVRLGEATVSTLRALVLIRDLTSQGIAVEWTLDCTADPGAVPRLVHLYPPSELVGAAEHDTEPDRELADWRRRFYVCKCVYRVGPGFLQVRDRRAGGLARFTLTDPRYLAAVDQLLPGCPRDAVPADVVAALEGESLALPIGDHLWWAPYRLRRWPFPSMTV